MAYLQSKKSVLARHIKLDCPDLIFHSGLDNFVDTTTNDSSVTEAGHPGSLSVVSESNYRCIEESASQSIASERYVIKIYI